MTKYIEESEIKKDIKSMLLVLQALTPKNTRGSDMLEEWLSKYDDFCIN